jgi:hypothetical protein
MSRPVSGRQLPRNNQVCAVKFFFVRPHFVVALLSFCGIVLVSVPLSEPTERRRYRHMRKGLHND